MDEEALSKPIQLNPFIKLATLPEPICATESRLVLPHSVNLRFQRGAFFLTSTPERFKITCATSGIEYFRCQEKWSFSEKKILWDVAGTPVLNLKKENLLSTLLSPYSTWSVFAGDNSGKVMFKVRVGGHKVVADFLDICVGRRRQLVLEWDFWERMAYIFVLNPEQDVPIAKLSTNLFSTNCYLEIAPEVDIALIVAMCIAAFA